MYYTFIFDNMIKFISNLLQLDLKHLLNGTWQKITFSKKYWELLSIVSLQCFFLLWPWTNSNHYSARRVELSVIHFVPFHDWSQEKHVIIRLHIILKKEDSHTTYMNTKTWFHKILIVTPVARHTLCHQIPAALSLPVQCEGGEWLKASLLSLLFQCWPLQKYTAGWTSTISRWTKVKQMIRSQKSCDGVVS